MSAVLEIDMKIADTSCFSWLPKICKILLIQQKKKELLNFADILLILLVGNVTVKIANMAAE